MHLPLPLCLRPCLQIPHICKLYRIVGDDANVETLLSRVTAALKLKR